MIYFDNAAATPLDPEVFKAMEPWMTGNFSNPGAVYQSAQQARAAVDEARMKVAKFLNCQGTEVYFTGSGTESNNWALKGVKKGHIISSVIEHASVLEPLRYLEQQGTPVSTLPVNAEGLISLDDLEKSIRPDTVLVSIHFVNNEIGTVQPIEEIAKICREKGVLFHTDACQAAPYFSLDTKKLHCDLLTFNAGKISGPKGVGVLFIRDGVRISPLLHGGGQEFKMRSGTEHVAGIVGLGKAVEMIRPEPQVKQLRDHLWAELQKRIPGVKLNGSLEHRSPNNLNVSFPGIDGEMLIRKLDLQGIAVSTTSACSSGISKPSHVLLALGKGTENSSIRISLSRFSTPGELGKFTQALAFIFSDPGIL